jgi:hypothetical protein
MRYQVTSYSTFCLFYSAWRGGIPDRGLCGASSMAVANTVNSWELDSTADYYVAQDHMSGYCIKRGELCAVWSRVGGRGNELVADAVWRGAESLNCFDGYLPTLYARHGFVEVARIANWVAGEPDVVIMAQPGSEYAWEAA